jgi:hypothetical protein
MINKKRIFTEQEIINSCGYVKGLEYEAPRDLLAGTLEIEPEKFEISLGGAKEQISINDDGTENISFGRVNVMYTFKLSEDMQYNLGLIVALDKGKPIAKIYSGMQVIACMNMCIFGAEQVQKFDILTTGMSYQEIFRNEFKKIEEKVFKGKQIIKWLKEIFISEEEINEINGFILMNLTREKGIAGTNPVLSAIKDQCNKSSKYYAKNGLSGWMYYNSLTEYLEPHVHILDIPEKALNLFSVIREYFNSKEKTYILTEFTQEAEKTILLT